MSNRDADRLREIFKNVSVHGAIGVGDGSVTPVITGRAHYTLMIQSVKIHILTDAARTLILRDTNGTPKVIFTLPASPGIGHFEEDWLPEGIPLTEGEDLDLVLSAAGLAFNYEIYAYLKPTGTMVPSEI